MVDLLISLSTDVDDLHPDKSAMTALMAAASNGSLAIIDKLLAGGAQVNKRNSDGVTALMHAAVLAHAHIVEGRDTYLPVPPCISLYLPVSHARRRPRARAHRR